MHKLIFTMIVVMKLGSSITFGQTQAAGGIALSDYYKNSPNRSLQCFMSRTHSKNKIQNLRQSFEAEIGPSINLFRSTKSVNFGYKTGATVWGDETHKKLIQPLTILLRFRGPGESASFRIVLSRDAISRTDGEFLLVDKLTTYFLRGSAKENGLDENTIALSSHTENPSIAYDPSGKTPSNLFLNYPRTIRNPVTEVRQTFESGESYYLNCFICSPGVANSCLSAKEFENLHDKEFFKSSTDSALENTFLGHIPLEFKSLN